MRKIKEVLRLRYELDLDQRQIARSCSNSLSTFHEYLRRAETGVVGRSIPAEWTGMQLQTRLFPATATQARPWEHALDFEGKVAPSCRVGRAAAFAASRMMAVHQRTQ